MNQQEYEPVYNAPDGGQEEKIGDFSMKVPTEYKWIAMIDRLSNGDITKHDTIYEMNWRSTLYLLSYWAVRDRVTHANNMAKNK